MGEGDTGDFRPHPTLYRNGRAIDVDSSVANGRAIYIDDRGVIVGNRLKGFTGVSGWSPVIWRERRDKPGRFTDTLLAPCPGGDAAARYGYATGANQSLQVVGYVQNSLFEAVGESYQGVRGSRAVVWLDDPPHTPVDLGTLPGDVQSVATGINNQGHVVGDSNRRAAGRDRRRLGHPFSVTAINDAGELAGIGRYRGQVRTFLRAPRG